MNKEIQQVPATGEGFGHQLKNDQKAFESCIKSLEEASMQIVKMDNPDAERLFNMISFCITKAHVLSYSANERYEQND